MFECLHSSFFFKNTETYRMVQKVFSDKGPIKKCHNKGITYLINTI